MVERRLRREVPERLRHDGHAETAFDKAACGRGPRCGRRRQGVAICFLYSFLDPAHEEAARRIAEKFPKPSSALRTKRRPSFANTSGCQRLWSTPISGRSWLYIRGVAERLTGFGVAAMPYLTQSNGGVIGFDAAARLPVRTALSGPSTGVVGAQVTARLAGAHDIITFDMGGTSTDVALMQGGEARLAREAVVHGYPIKAPMLDIHTVGAGGGSIALIDTGGLLKVGPRSAGADPGPACYGRGNDEPTVTDANVVLQTLSPTQLLGGRMRFRPDLAQAAIDRIAARLDIRRVLVPRNPGILCAMGLLLADLRADSVATRLMALSSPVISEVEAIVAGLRRRCAVWFADAGIETNDRRVALSVDMRYAGRRSSRAFRAAARRPGHTRDDRWLAAGFTATHQRLYGFVAEDEPMQLVTFRAAATGIVPKAEIRPGGQHGPRPLSGGVRAPRRVAARNRRVRFLSAFTTASGSLPAIMLEELAVVEQMDATTLIVPGAIATVDLYLNLLLELA